MKIAVIGLNHSTTTIMKTGFATLLLSLFISGVSLAQNCLDLSNYTTAYIDSAGQDDINFPVGSTIVGNGAIEIKKIDLITQWMGLQGDSALFYIGNTELDVSGYNCSNKRLTFTNSYTEQMIIDGDTVYAFNPPGSFYQGNGFTVSFNGSGLGSGDFVIEGDFDVVRLLGSTNVIWDICIECLAGTQPTCLDLSNYTTAYIDSAGQDNVNFPVGSTIVGNGAIEIKKIDLITQWMGLQGDSALFYIGNTELDVSGYNCSNKRLTFTNSYTEQMIIDGDTVYAFNPPGSFYQGNGFTVSFNGSGLGGGDFVIEGDFDVVRMLGSTNLIWDICIECLAGTQPTCLDLSNYTTAYIDSAGQDDVNFPVGSTIVGNGAIEIKKIDLITQWMGLQGDSALFYIGNTELDVSGYNCSNKRLTFTNSYTEQMIIDGDTVYAFNPPGSFYQGNGFTVSFDGSGLGGGDFVIEGDFDVVRLLGSTNLIWDVCIECLTTASITDWLDEGKTQSILVYPNPSAGVINLKVPELALYDIQVFNSKGQLVHGITEKFQETIVNLSIQPRGLYFVRVVSDNGWVQSKKILLE